MKWIGQIFICLLMLLWTNQCFVFAQQTSPDTLPDYPLSKKADLDTSISYQAHNVSTDISSRITKLSGEAEVHYQNTILTAGLITIDWDKNLLIAEAIRDTAKAESGNDDHSQQDSLNFIGYPVFTEGNEKMTGQKMFYNFKTRKGRVIRGRTQYEQGYYVGNRIKKTTDDVYYVKHGRFTTCNLDTPHFHFSSNKMKMIQNDKVIAKPIIMYIHNVPIAALPFGVFPNRRGRHSGILVPRYGESATEGRYLRGLGYYWAPSPYWDTKFEVDFFEQTGFIFHNTINYAVRYLLRGTVSASLLRKSYDGREKSRWDVAFNHSHTISPTMNISAHGSFVSDGSYYQDYSGNRNQRLKREIRSNATFSKRWSDSRNSLTMNVSRSQYLDTDSWRETLPRISFRHGQEPLINLFRADREQTRSSMTVADRAWYENIYFSYNSQLLNSRSKTRSTKKNPFQKQSFLGAQHRMTLTSPFKLFRYFTLNQNINYTEVWQDRVKDYYLDAETNTIKSSEKKGFFARRTFNTSFRASTKIYGIFPVNRWTIVGFRHVITPNVSISYQPDFSDPVFGYYQEIEDTTGKVIKKDRFQGSQYGGTLSRSRRNINFSVNNLFQMKRIVDEKEKKTNLFTWNLSSSYNLESDSLRLSPVRSSVRASPSRIFNFSLNFTHSFYQYNKNLNHEVNQYLIAADPFHPLRLTNIRLSSSLRLRHTLFQWGKKKKGDTEDSSADTTANETSTQEVVGETIGNRFEMEQDWAGAGKEIPWNANLSLNYSESRFDPDAIRKTFWLNMNGQLQLTKNWRIRYNARFDLKEKKIVSQDIRIYRDLHCWEASFTWSPTGPYKRFYLRINIKSSLLKDIKLEKRGGRGAIFGY